MFFKVNIQLFAEGAGDGSGADGADGAGNSAVNAENTEAKAEETEEDGTLPEESESEKRTREYAEFKKKFKNEFNEETQNIVRGRVEKLAKENDRFRTAIEKIGVQYGIMSGDVDAILDRMTNDRSVFERRAEEIGSTADNVEKMFKLEMQNKRSEEELRRQAAERQYQNWQEQSNEVRDMYDDGFDFNSEMDTNPDFRRLVINNVPVKTAYEVTNRDKLSQRVAKITHDKTEKAVTDRIKARGNRPAENGAGVNSTGTIAFNPASLTKEQREDIRRRVRAGEKISF